MALNGIFYFLNKIPILRSSMQNVHRHNLFCSVIKDFMMGFFPIIYYFYNERSDEHNPRPHIRICLLSIWNSLLIPVLIKNQIHFVCSRTCVPL